MKNHAKAKPLTGDGKNAYEKEPREKGKDMNCATNAPSTNGIVAFLPPSVKGIDRTTEMKPKDEQKRYKVK